MRRITVIILLLVSMIPAAAQQSRLNVVTSTTIIADIARNVGGDLVEVTTLIPADTDSHAFELRPADIVMIEEADLLLINGGGLEKFLAAVIENSSAEPFIVAAGLEVFAFHHEESDTAEHADTAESLGILGEDVICDDLAHAEATAEAPAESTPEHDHSECDPHFWGNPLNVSIYAQNIASAFAQLDPANAGIYAENAAVYQQQMTDLDAEISAILSSVPVENRVIVTNHEFLGYFAAHYGFEIVGTVIPGISTLAETNPRELAALQELIRAEGVRAIFAEVSQTGELAQVLAAELGSEIQVIYLYSEALSATDGPAASYVDYMLYNVHAIAEALRAE